MSDPHPLDDPVKKQRVVRLLLILTPFMFVFAYLIAALQGAETRHALLIAVAGVVLCAGAAGVIQLLGSRSWMALVAIKIALLLVGKR